MAILEELNKIFKRLAVCLPEVEDLKTPESFEELPEYCDKAIILAINMMKNYQQCLQQLENSLPLTQNEIQLKIYYEHLESIITELKQERTQKIIQMDEMKTEIDTLRSKQKYYLTMTNINTKQNSQQINNGETKIDTITKIKNRLSLSNTSDFYPNKLIKKNQKQSKEDSLVQKRQSLTETLQKYYENPHKTDNQPANKSKSKEKRAIESKSKDSTKIIKNSHSGQRIQKQKKMVKHVGKSRKSLQKGINQQQNIMNKQKSKKTLNKSGISSRKSSFHL